MYDLFYDHIDFGGEAPNPVPGADPTPEELEAFWAWVATLNPDPEIPF